MFVTDRFFSTSLRVTVKATHFPSGDKRGSPTRDRRCMSSTWKGCAAHAVTANDNRANEQMRVFIIPRNLKIWIFASSSSHQGLGLQTDGMTLGKIPPSEDRGFDTFTTAVFPPNISRCRWLFHQSCGLPTDIGLPEPRKDRDSVSTACDGDSVSRRFDRRQLVGRSRARPP